MSYRHVRKKDKAMSMEKIEEFIKSESIAHLAMSGSNGYPYVVPLNYAYLDGRFILHSATKGQKSDFLEADPRVCLTISRQHCIKTEGLIPCKEFDTPFTSIIAFGKATFPEGELKINYLTEFVRYYMQKDDPPVTEFDTNFMLRTCAIVVEVDHLTGKSSAGEE